MAQRGYGEDPQAALAPELAASHVLVSAQAPACGRAPRVLLVDDGSTTADEVIAPLQRGGYLVTRVRDGEAALALLERERYDIVLLDTALSDASGLEVCRELRRRDDIPVVFLSARGTLAERLAGFEAGADEYIVRPAASEEIACRLQAVLRRVYRGSAREVLAGPQGLAIDVRAHEVRVRDSLVTVTPREFAVLRLLLTRRGEVLTWDNISTQVWGYETFGCRNFVEAQVSRLRAKLRAAGAFGTITTVRGVGYVVR